MEESGGVVLTTARAAGDATNFSLNVPSQAKDADGKRQDSHPAQQNDDPKQHLRDRIPSGSAGLDFLPVWRLKNFATLHNKVDLFEHRDIMQRIAFDGDNVGKSSR